MLNVELIRKVQSSIADQNNPYNKGRWTCCIAAHTVSVAKGLSLPLELDGKTAASLPRLAQLILGLTAKQSIELFYINGPIPSTVIEKINERILVTDRFAAVRELDELIFHAIQKELSTMLETRLPVESVKPAVEERELALV